MNFLKNTKKKIQTAVHGKRTKDDDDDDYDNYVAEVPPHPSLDPNNTSSFTPDFNAAFSNFSAATETLANSLSTVLSFDKKEEDRKELSLEELKAKEEENKQEERVKLRQQEETKKDKEEWKFFLSLTAKVDDITSKTQSSLTKLKDDSAIDEISKAEDPCFADQYDDSVPKSAGGWVAFDEEHEFNPADPIFHLPKQEEKVAEPEPQPVVVDESTIKLAKQLIDDFGFTNLAPGIGDLVGDQIKTEGEDTTDPFDTSFINVEAIRSGKAAEIVEKKKEEIISKFDQDVTFDPFDTTHVESAINKDLLD